MPEQVEEEWEMRIDGLVGGSFDEVGPRAAALEAAGYDGAFTAETAHDPFLELVVAAQHTERIELGTAIAVAFARTPMTLGVTANDLHRASKGRLVVGLGSQIKPHIERRFSMPWSHPAPRMREFVLAMRAIWASWNEGTKLDFRGDFYQHTLMTPFFNPGPNPYGTPKVWLAAVGPHMTEVAGEVADGMLLHGFTTERYVREVTVPALERGFAALGTYPRGLRGGRPDLRRDRRERSGVRRRPSGHAATDRLLRLHARVLAGCWSSTDGVRSATSSTRCRSAESGWRWVS